MIPRPPRIDENRPDLIPTLVLATACNGLRGVILSREDVLPFFQAHEGCQFVCHNASFDLKVTQQLFGDRCDLYECVEANQVWDTLILKRLLCLATEGHTARGEAGLADCVKATFGFDLDKVVKDAAGHLVRHSFAQFLFKPLVMIPAKYLHTPPPTR